MKYALIDQADIDELPDDPYAAFVAFESICRQRLGEVLATLGEHDNWDEPRLRYISKVSVAAKEYDVPGWDELPEPNVHNFQYEHFAAFDHAVTQITTALQIKKAKQRNAESVRLPVSRAAEITKYVEILRRRIEASDFDEKKKASLYKKLEALRAELTGKRADLSKTMLIIASVMTAVNQAEAAVIKLPEAIAAVMKVIGYVKEDEDAEKAAIAAAAAPKAIEDMRRRAPPSKAHGGFSSQSDDEIPF